MGHADHKSKSGKTVSVFVATISDSRNAESDTSGKYIKDKLMAAGHTISGYALLKDEPEEIKALLGDIPAGTQAVILNGGTGISKRDRTYDAVVAKLDKILPGFGEIFRMLSFQEIGTSAIMSRAVAGLMGEIVVISIPGSTGAVSLAMDSIILNELPHMVWEASR